MKRKLLFLATLVVSALGMRAQQQDVTATYLTNADFSSGTPIDNAICTYGKDMASNGTTYYSAQPITGWTNASVGDTDSGYDNSKLAGGLFAYGGTPWLAGSGNTAPATDPNGNAGNAAGLCAVWGGSVQYTQNVTLPAGGYTIVFKVYNATSGDGNSSGVITTNLFGFSAGSTTYYAPNNTFAIGQWVTVAVNFNLSAETAGKISMGYVGPSGNAAMPHLFVDNVKILKNVMPKDFTDKVNKTGWTGAGDGYQGGAINTARQYGDKSVGRHIYQTVSGLDNGTYEVAVYSTSQKEWTGSLANDAGDVAYVFADNGTVELKEWINARARATYPGDENMGIYTISGVQVTNGTLTIGMGLAKADLTEWHHMQIKSLVRTYIDLTDLIEAYNNALTEAKAIGQSQKMSASVKTSLNTTIDTYDTGKVSTEDGEALQTATDALKAATTMAEKSIASYAIIASGSIPDNSLDGWVCENSNTFHINTWSSEGNNDGSQMKTPFIENWVGKGSYLGAGKVYYKLEGLEPGEIFYAQALVRSYNEASSDAPNGPDFFINDVVTSLSTAGTTFTYNNMSGIYATLGGAATIGADGTLTLGVEIATDRNYNWVAFKNISIQSMDDAFDAAVAKVTALSGKIPSAAYDVAYAKVTEYSGANYPTTATGFETAISEIEAAATTASACISPYANAKTLLAQGTTLATNYPNLSTQATELLETKATAAEINSFSNDLAQALAVFKSWLDLKTSADALVAVDNNNASANTTLAGVINEQEANVQAVNEISAAGLATVTTSISTLKTAMVTYVTTAEPTNDECFDLTFMIVNPHFTEGAGGTAIPTGWTLAEGGSITEHRLLTHNFEAYHTPFNLSQTIPNLPNGTYKVTLQGFARHDNNGPTDKTNLYCGIVNQPIKNITDEYSTTSLISDKPAMGDTNGEANSGGQYRPNGMSASYYYFQEINPATNQPFYTNEVQTLITEPGDLKIGFKCETNTDWVIWDNFHLYYYGSAIAVTIDEDAASSSYTEDIENANVTLHRTFSTGKWNTFFLPFELTDAEIKTAFGTDAEVAKFSEIPDGLNSTINFDKATDGISANVPVLLKTNAAGGSFTFNGKTIKAGEAKIEAGNFDFVGTYAATTTIAENDYFISGNKLYKSSGATTIKGTRAYLKNKDGNSTIKSLNIFDEEGNATAIDATEIEGLNVNGKFYDLSGREVKTPVRGLYIQNGKKVFIK